MSEFDFKGALASVTEIGYDLGDSEDHRAEIQAALRHCARVQSGELVVVPREGLSAMTDDEQLRLSDVALETYHEANKGCILIRSVIHHVFNAIIAAAPKHDWSE